MTQKIPHVAIVSPSGRTTKSPDELAFVREQLCQEHVERLTLVETRYASVDGCTKAPATERAAMLAQALTRRDLPVLWCERGGVGTTNLMGHLENMLPPILPDKTLVGFSDISFLGVYLALRHPNFTYVHGEHPYNNFLKAPLHQQRTLKAIMRGDLPPPCQFPVRSLAHVPAPLEGPLVPLNLSLAESLAAVRHITLPEGSLLFLEDVSEDLYRIVRKLDSLVNSGFLENVQAIVCGEFSWCKDPDDKPLPRQKVLDVIQERTQLPVFDFPYFGHDESRFPLVALSKVSLLPSPVPGSPQALLTLRFERDRRPGEGLSTRFPATLGLPKDLQRIHFTGIGGTGMAQVAGLMEGMGYRISGTDGPLYPPMSEVVKALRAEVEVGFSAEAAQRHQADWVVLGNVASRVGFDLKPHVELEGLVQQNRPLLSFPSALRKSFLHKKKNIVIAGTHGKTTTSSLMAWVLTRFGWDPSFLIGGSPKNFGKGYHLGKGDWTVLEGDEYDSAFFDKGPKFLHYHPTVSLLNNIEFDHADIYPDVNAITDEFHRLAALTQDNKGVNVVNLSCERSKQAAARAGGLAVTFGPFGVGADWETDVRAVTAQGTRMGVLHKGHMLFDVTVPLFGQHNARNVAAVCACFEAAGLYDRDRVGVLKEALATFQGVRRRFDLLGVPGDVAVFDDFAHHPTALTSTLEALRDYHTSAGRKGRLLAVLDPRNATLRRKVFQDSLPLCFKSADLAFVGKVPQDLRVASESRLDGQALAKACPVPAESFEDNERLLLRICDVAKPGDTVAFFSSGSFDGLPQKCHDFFKNRMGEK